MQHEMSLLVMTFIWNFFCIELGAPHVHNKIMMSDIKRKILNTGFNKLS
jgi:hypothetical protein